MTHRAWALVLASALALMGFGVQATATDGSEHHDEGPNTFMVEWSADTVNSIDGFAGFIADDCQAKSRELTEDELRRFAGSEQLDFVDAALDCDGGACGCFGCYFVPTPWGTVPICLLCGACCDSGEVPVCKCAAPNFWELRCSCDDSGGALIEGTG